MKIFRHLPFLLGLVLAGCATAPKLSNTPPVETNPFAELRKNMSADQVTALVGKPRTVKPFKAPGLTVEGLASEIWTYERKVASTTGQIAVGTRDVPFYDPFTQVTKMIKEPVYHTQTITVVEIIDLLMIQEQLIEWKAHRETDRRID